MDLVEWRLHVLMLWKSYSFTYCCWGNKLRKYQLLINEFMKNVNIWNWSWTILQWKPNTHPNWQWKYICLGGQRIIYLIKKLFSFRNGLIKEAWNILYFFVLKMKHYAIVLFIITYFAAWVNRHLSDPKCISSTLNCWAETNHTKRRINEK